MNSTTYGVDEYGNEAADVRSGYIGEFKKFGFSGVPKHCLACDGSEISRATYSELFEVFGETYGAGDGETTFNLPDFRGAFLRCIGGNAAALGTQQSATLVSQYALGNNGTCIALAVYNRDSDKAMPPSNTLYAYRPSSYIPREDVAQADIGWTMRPINYAVNICVVYE